MLVNTRLTFFGGLAIATLVFAFALRRFSFASHPASVLALLALQLLSGIAYPLVSVGVAPEIVLALNTPLVIVTLPLINLAWSEAFADLPPRRLVALTATSLALCAVVLAVVQQLPEQGAMAFMVILPLGLAGLYLLLRWEPKKTEAPAQPLPSRSGLVAYLMAVFFAAAASCVLRGSSEVAGFIGWSSVILGVLASSAVLAAFALAGKAQALQKIAALCAGVMALTFAVSGLFFGSSGGFDANLSPLFHGIAYAAQQCLYAVVWIALIERARATGSNPIFYCGIGFAAIYGGETVGIAAGMFAPLQPSVLSILALILLVPSMYLFAASTHIPEGRNPEGAEERSGSSEQIEARVSRLANSYGLTAREADIARLWVTGHRLDYLESELCISKSTVKTHLRHIYQKTGTANKEELITLVETL